MSLDTYILAARARVRVLVEPAFPQGSWRVEGVIPEESGRLRRQLYIAFGLLTAGMLVFSQTRSLLWDEGFHILAAHLIDTGKRPYLDFIYAQTPLNAYWNAGWMRLFGQSWRVVHAVATVATMASIALIVGYVVKLFSGPRWGSGWQSTAAFTTLALLGFHARVWKVGTIAQAYPLCLLLVVLAFRIAIAGVDRPGPGGSALAGLLAGAAASSSLLTAQAAPVLLIWMWFHNRAGNRWIKSAAFVGGGLAACVPLFLLFIRDPHVVLFDILKYHAVYRQLDWSGATAHDIGILTDWVNSTPNLLLALLAGTGVILMKESGFDEIRRGELWLCFWLALAMGVQNMFAHPTFPMYFVFLIPFLAVLGTVGFYVAVTRVLPEPGRQRPAFALLLVITLACLGNSVYDDTDHYTWPEFEQVAAKVREVTPKDAPVLASEQIYFLLGGPVPPGMEYDDSHKLRFSAEESARLHVIPEPEVEEQIKAGAFATAEVCNEEGQFGDVDFWKDYYAQSTSVQLCNIYWDFKGKGAAAPPSK